MFDLKKIIFFCCIWFCFVLFPSRNRHVPKLETTSEFCLVLEKQWMESKLMLLFNGTDMLIINIPHNSKTIQKVEMEEISRPDT